MQYHLTVAMTLHFAHAKWNVTPTVTWYCVSHGQPHVRLTCLPANQRRCGHQARYDSLLIWRDLFSVISQDSAVNNRGKGKRKSLRAQRLKVLSCKRLVGQSVFSLQPTKTPCLLSCFQKGKKWRAREEKKNCIILNTGDKTNQNKNYCLILCIQFIKQMMFFRKNNDCIRHHRSVFFFLFSSSFFMRAKLIHKIFNPYLVFS